MREAIVNRISRRTYGGPIDSKEAEEIQALVSKVNRESGLTMELDADAGKAFASKKYTKGFIENASSVILMKGPSDLPDLKERIGYYGEGLVLDLVDLGYGTCWVAGTVDRSMLFEGDDETLVCVVIVGNVGEQTVSERTIRGMVRTNIKKPMEMLESDTEEIPEWILEAMESVVKAPSAMNRQKPLFRYAEGMVTASIADDYVMDRVDLGIAKRHFVESAGGSFDLGNGSSYHREK